MFWLLVGIRWLGTAWPFVFELNRLLTISRYINTSINASSTVVHSKSHIWSVISFRWLFYSIERKRLAPHWLIEVNSLTLGLTLKCVTHDKTESIKRVKEDLSPSKGDYSLVTHELFETSKIKFVENVLSFKKSFHSTVSKKKFENVCELTTIKELINYS